MNAALNAVPDDERERQICIKLAVLAALPLPTLGDRYAVNKEEVLLYQSDKLTVVASSLGPGKVTGPITHFGSYEETCGSDSFAGLFVEFLEELCDKDTGVRFQIPVYAKITQNDKQLLSPCTGASTSRSVCDDEPPSAMEVDEAPAAETIEQLIAAGIDSVVDHEWASFPGTSLPEEATPHTDVTARPRRDFPDVIRL